MAVASAGLWLALACAPVGGPVTGAADDHCTLSDGGFNLTQVDAASCHPDGGSDEVDGGTADFGPPHDNTTAYDDDCKYKVDYSVTPVKENTHVTFTVKLTSAADGTPVTGANAQVEAFMDTHPARGTPTSTEPTPGTYEVGPLQFDAAGTWVVRFHFFEECSDVLDDSPHGHAAFYLRVP